MDAWSGVDFFQVDNLVRGRVFFHILNLGVNFDELYPISKFPMERIHLRNREIQLGNALDARGVVREVLAQQISKEDPIVVFCFDGKASLAAAQALTEQGFKNVYYARGGMEKLLADSQVGQA